MHETDESELVAEITRRALAGELSDAALVVLAALFAGDCEPGYETVCLDGCEYDDEDDEP